MASGTDERWKDLDITKDEVERIGKALKDEEFRKMFVEYAQEISDPKNRALYEQEIAQMEAERGMDVQFIHPKPGHVVKVMASSLECNDPKKVFINICHNDFIGKPSHEKGTQSNGKVGLQWSIPHSFSPAREDLDKQGEKCAVYDVVFHPDTYTMSSNPGFMNMLHDTAFDGLERQFGLKIDRKAAVKLKNLKFKGRPEPTIMRKKKEESTSSDEKTKNVANESDPLAKFPYPYENGTSSEELAKKKAQQVSEQKKRKDDRIAAKSTSQSAGVSEEKRDDNGVITPEYTLTNQYGMDMGDYSQSLTGSAMATSANVPQALVVSVSLPQLRSAAPCQLDVTERHLSLQSTDPVAYNLSVKLPYPVDDENGSAKFDKTKRRLVVTLPVCKAKLEKELLQALGGAQLNGSEDSNSNNKPLIEELSPTTQPTSETCPKIHVTKETSEGDSVQSEEPDAPNETPKEQKHSTTNSGAIILDDKISYRKPSFSHDQEEDAITIILDVTRTEPQSLKVCSHEREVEVLFSTRSPTGFPTHYYIKFVFPSSVSPDISISVGEKNVLLNISKTCGALWERFTSCGQDEADAKDHEFVTRAHIEQEIKQFETTATEEKPKDADTGPKSQQTKSKPLTIDIKSAHERNESDMLLSPHVEVIHKHSPPANIHSILKRTLSESSGAEDVNGSGGSSEAGTSKNSPDVQAENGSDMMPSPRERKKSVSFSDKVEEAMFKSKDSVCQMHKTLLNRRKKQRQRENRKEGRNRRNSSTEHSSGDENGSKKQGNRRRRNSSNSSDGDQSPRSNGSSICSNDAMSSSTEGDQLCTCDPADDEHTHDEQLNSDDDEASPEVEPKNGAQSKSAMNWSDESGFVEKTKCAFNFKNSVIYDLDE